MVALGKVVAVETMSAKPAVKPTSVALCHFTTVPVCPLKVKAAGEVPEQIVCADATAPPTETGFTTIDAVLFELITLEQIEGAVPLERFVTVIVLVADNILVENVPVVPLKTMVAVFPLLPGLVVLYVTV